MTVCIGALAENRKKLVLAADKMITANIPIAYQFEKEDVQKIYTLSEKVRVLTAGNALFAFEIVENTKKDISKSALDGKPFTSVEEYAECIRVNYQNFRRKIIVQSVLEPRGLNLQSYYQLQKSLNPGIVQEIEQAFINYNLGVDLIVAGVNDDSCHLYSITHPGVSTSHDAIGYVSVGSGAPHAMYSLIASAYTKGKTLDEVKTFVEEAKKRSEVAPGVGKETEIVILQ